MSMIIPVTAIIFCLIDCCAKGVWDRPLTVGHLDSAVVFIAMMFIFSAIDKK